MPSSTCQLHPLGLRERERVSCEFARFQCNHKINEHIHVCGMLSSFRRRSVIWGLALEESEPRGLIREGQAGATANNISNVDSIRRRWSMTLKQRIATAANAAATTTTTTPSSTRGAAARHRSSPTCAVPRVSARRARRVKAKRTRHARSSSGSHNTKPCDTSAWCAFACTMRIRQSQQTR